LELCEAPPGCSGPSPRPAGCSNIAPKLTGGVSLDCRYGENLRPMAVPKDQAGRLALYQRVPGTPAKASGTALKRASERAAARHGGVAADSDRRRDRKDSSESAALGQARKVLASRTVGLSNGKIRPAAVIGSIGVVTLKARPDCKVRSSIRHSQAFRCCSRAQQLVRGRAWLEPRFNRAGGRYAGVMVHAFPGLLPEVFWDGFAPLAALDGAGASTQDPSFDLSCHWRGAGSLSLVAICIGRPVSSGIASAKGISSIANDLQYPDRHRRAAAYVDGRHDLSHIAFSYERAGCLQRLRSLIMIGFGWPYVSFTTRTFRCGFCCGGFSRRCADESWFILRGAA